VIVAATIVLVSSLLIASPNSRLLPVGRTGAALIGEVAVVVTGALGSFMQLSSASASPLACSRCFWGILVRT